MRSIHLIYHEVRKQESAYSYVMDLGEFERHLDLFSQLRKKSPVGILPEVTFDDGHISGHDDALPLLVEHGLSAHFFVTAGWIGSKENFMDWPEVRALHEAGQHVGAHGWSHTLLTHCNASELRRELRDARVKIEDELGCSITTMSLPGGRYNRRVLDGCRESGYTRIYTSQPKIEMGSEETLIGRLNIRRDMSLAWLEELFQPQSKTMSGLERQAKMKLAVRSILGDRLYAGLWSVLNRQEPEAQP